MVWWGWREVRHHRPSLSVPLLVKENAASALVAASGVSSAAAALHPQKVMTGCSH